jgi:hypothetical protein
MEKTERFTMALTEEEMEKLALLADANTGSNKSLMLRRLISLAWLNPSAIDLHLPKRTDQVAQEKRALQYANDFALARQGHYTEG